MKRKGLLIFNDVLGIIICLIFSIILQSCPSPDNDDIYIDCVSNIDINKFQFYGNYQTEIEIYDRDTILDSLTMEADSEQIPVLGTSNITFNEDKTFELLIELVCDSLHSALPVCSPEDYSAGSIYLHLAGRWGFNQEYETQYQASGYGEMIHLNTIKGNCLMSILNSNNEEFIGKEIVAAIILSCLQDSPNEYYLDFEFNYTLIDRIYLQFRK
jgi:hypothetical protein